jgi:hypothetical protein
MVRTQPVAAWLGVACLRAVLSQPAAGRSPRRGATTWPGSWSRRLLSERDHVMGIRSAKVALAALLLFTACQTKPKFPPEVQPFYHKYDSIREDMTEQEVDAILAGYRSNLLKEERDCDAFTAKPLKRRSTFTKSYGREQDPMEGEGDYYIDVYFDANGLVVGKLFGVYCR